MDERVMSKPGKNLRDAASGGGKWAPIGRDDLHSHSDGIPQAFATNQGWGLLVPISRLKRRDVPAPFMVPMSIVRFGSLHQMACDDQSGVSSGRSDDAEER